MDLVLVNNEWDLEILCGGRLEMRAENNIALKSFLLIPFQFSAACKKPQKHRPPIDVSLAHRDFPAQHDLDRKFLLKTSSKELHWVYLSSLKRAVSSSRRRVGA